MTTALRLFAVAASLACTTPSFAITSSKVEQESASDSVLMAYFSQADLAQSFIQFADNITGAGVKVTGGAEYTVSISLWTNLPNNGGKMLASGEGTGDGDSWVDVFWPKVTIEPDSLYFLVFSGTTDSGLRGDTGNPYPYGNVFGNSGYQSFPAFDYAFRTYSEAAPVPEPATWMSLLAGLAVCAGGVSRRRS
ncbi:MAG: PEP-CTERM sorting domain-containing protein [Thauera sp.]|nr:MAG: PEP-CTERM sorting domain-containing protein [Thauera sp.]